MYMYTHKHRGLHRTANAEATVGVGWYGLIRAPRVPTNSLASTN